MLSLARTDGARKDIRAEVAKLKVQCHERGQLVQLPLSA
jgi:hypothetical protein